MNRKVCVLMGSPHPDGNTASLLSPLVRRMEKHGCAVTTFHLYDCDIRPCIACRACQTDWERPNCCQCDGMQEIFDAVLSSDLLILATPIFSWYCTPPMKAALDRMVYALCKYYGGKRGPSLLTGKKLALLSTCGYRPENGSDLWETGMQRYCRHTPMQYCGAIAERHLGYDVPFMDDGKAERAEAFADRLVPLILN